MSSPQRLRPKRSMDDRSPQKTGQTPDPKSKRGNSDPYALRRFDTLDSNHPQNRQNRLARIHPQIPQIPRVTSPREIKLQESCYAKVDANGRRMTKDYFCLKSPSMHKTSVQLRFRGGYKKKRKTRKKKRMKRRTKRRKTKRRKTRKRRKR